jgi:hypothetical protein
LIYEFSPDAGEQTEDWVLAMNISQEDAEGVTILIMDNTFTIKKLKLDQKNG